MAFTVERGALHRPLGYRAAGTGSAASGGTIGETIQGTITVERWAADQGGATAVLLAPPDGAADDANRALRRALAEGLGELHGVVVAPNSTLPIGWPAGLARPAAAPPASERSRDSGADGGFARLAEALASSGVPSALATTRGIVDGELVSLLGLACGRLRPAGRSNLRVAVVTDARLDRATLEPLLRESAAPALAAIAGLAMPLPGDGVVALANGLAQSSRVEAGSLGFETLRVGATALLQELMRALLEQAWSPAAACLVQASVVGASSDAEAAARAEEIATSEELERAVRESLQSGGATAGAAARVDRFVVRRSKDGAQLAIALELGRGRFGATRWLALPRSARSPQG